MWKPLPLTCEYRNTRDTGGLICGLRRVPTYLYIHYMLFTKPVRVEATCCTSTSNSTALYFESRANYSSYTKSVNTYSVFTTML